MIRHFRELYQYRGLLLSLVQRELKARYRGSVLGFLWTFLNPTLHMLVYGLLFGVVMKNQVEHYPFFMFVGLLPWIWFTSSVAAGASAISDRRDLLTKVRFPAQVLPASVVLTNLANYVLSLPLLILLGAFYGEWPSWHIVAFPLVVFIQLGFIMGAVYIISAINVTFRDLQQIVANLLTLWFFVTPIFYQATTIPERFRTVAVLANPMAVMVTSYQAIFYEQRLPDAGPLLLWMAIAFMLLMFASVLFERRREEFAEFV